MKLFAIADIERFTGIRAHTFRTWEQRYCFLKPKRKETNIRYYDIEDLKLILDISLINKFGYKASLLEKLGPEGIRDALRAITGDPEAGKADQINKLIVAMYATDTESFEKILGYCISVWGINNAIEDVIMPFLEKVQLQYYTDTSNEVHLAVTAIRRKLILGIENAHPREQIQKTALLFLPKGDHFDLILLYMTYVAKLKGYKTIYLGTDIALANLEQMVVSKRPDLVCTYLVPRSHFEVKEVDEILKRSLEHYTLLLCGFTGRMIQIPASNARLVNYKCFRQELSELAKPMQVSRV